MKKLMLVAVLAMFAFNANAQDFGVTVSYANISFDEDGSGIDENGSGATISVFAEFEISEQFSVQPELAYTFSSVDIPTDPTYNLFNINALAKYEVFDNFSILAGPQLGFASGDIPDALDDAFGDDFSSLNFQLALGLSYDITENILVQARYAFQLGEHVDDLGAVNAFTIGAGYRF